MISVGKSTLIYCTNPMFSMILAYFVLNEKVTKLVIVSTIGAFVGIYFLSMNKQNSESDTNVILGIVFVLISAFFQAVIFVSVRMLNVCYMPITFRPFYVGWAYLSVGVF